MADDREPVDDRGLDGLEGLDPYDLLDAEADRIGAFLDGLDDEGWAMPSRCEGWSVRDLAAHLAATEEYHHVCLEGDLAPFLERGLAAGATDVHGFNALGIRERAGRDPAEVLEEWRAANAQTRARMRARDGGVMTTMVGPYPVRLQAFHVASELATHADDLGVPVDPDQAAARLAWRVRVSRFLLAESAPELRFTAVAGGTRVTVGDRDVVVPDAAFVEAVAGRLDDDGGLPPDVREALSTMP